jgi:hypothetical protein
VLEGAQPVEQLAGGRRFFEAVLAQLVEDAQRGVDLRLSVQSLAGHV